MTDTELRITLPEGLARYVAEGVERGFFRDESEAVSEALRRIIHDDARLTFLAEEHVQAYSNEMIGMSWQKSFDHRPARRDDLEAGFVCIDSDEIVPVKITHDRDDMYQDGALIQTYNFIVYEFEEDGVWLWAKHYLDSMGEVSMSLPMLSRDRPDMEATAPGLVRKARAYLERRFATVSAYPRYGT